MTRSELYALVWSEPVHKLALRLGLSGAGLTKLCIRHGIPTPTRGYWQQRSAGQSVRPTPLPDRADDVEIPRFRQLDAAGAPRELDEWVIPGVLRRSYGAPTEVTTPSVIRLPPAAAPVAQHQPSANTGASSTPAAAPATATELPALPRPAAPPPTRFPRTIRQQEAPLPTTPALRGQMPIGFDAAALDAELERAAVVASEHHRRQVVQQLLAAVAVRATLEDAAAARTILAWVAAVKPRLELDDPVARLVESLRSSGQEPPAWPWWPDKRG